MEVKAPVFVNATEEIIVALVEKAGDLAFIKFSAAGAMGSPGDVVLGVVDNTQLTCHHFNLNDKDCSSDLFDLATKKLYRFVSNNVRGQSNNSFRIAGGMGNHLQLNNKYKFEWIPSEIFLVEKEFKTPLQLNIPLHFPQQLFPQCKLDVRRTNDNPMHSHSG